MPTKSLMTVEGLAAGGVWGEENLALGAACFKEHLRVTAAGTRNVRATRNVSS